MTRAAGPAPIALTMGDPAGIGGEITLKAWLARTDAAPPFVALDDPDRLSGLARLIGLEVPIAVVDTIDEGPDIFASALPVLPVPLDVEVASGEPNVAAADAVIGSIDKAVELALAGTAGAVVTNPVHKETLYQAGFAHPGHTEYLAAKTGSRTQPVMLLASRELRVVPATIHLSLRAAIEALSVDQIVHCGLVARESLRRDFAVVDPVIAVAGLNPHAGEAGHLGTEEQEVIEPAIERLRSKGCRVTGPMAPDTMFHEEARGGYDVAICMYHDQALIPLKTLDFHGGVNVTLGIPIVRTSPDHGTAFDIAGTGRASPTSLLRALELAAEMARHRADTALSRAIA